MAEPGVPHARSGRGGAEARGASRVRPLEAGDREALVRMRTALWPDSTSEEVDALVAGRDEDAYAVLVAERAGRPVGFAEVGTRPWAEGCHGTPVAYLEGIWVDPTARRSGVATALVDAAVDWARARGLEELASDTELDNAPSAALHRATGFEEVMRMVTWRRTVD